MFVTKKGKVMLISCIVVFLISILLNLFMLYNKDYIIFYGTDKKIKTANSTNAVLATHQSEAVPNKESAIEIAKAYINKTMRFKSKDSEPYRAIYNEQYNMWVVYGTVPKGSDGIAYYVIIDKKAGTLISLGGV